MEGQPGSPVLGFLQHQTAPARVTVIFIGFPSSKSTATINAPDLASNFPARRIVVEVPATTKASYTIDDFLSHIKSTHLASDHGIYLDSVLYSGPPGFSIVTRQQSVSVLRDGEYLIVAACGAPVSSAFSPIQIGDDEAPKTRDLMLDAVEPKKSPGRRHVHHHVVHKHTCCQQRDATETLVTSTPNAPTPAQTHTRHLHHQSSTSHHHSSHKARPPSPSGSSADVVSVTSSADSRQRRRASQHHHQHDYGRGRRGYCHSNHRIIPESSKRTTRAGGECLSDEETNGDDLNRTVANLLRDESIQDLLKNVLQSLATKLGSSPPRKGNKAAESGNQSEWGVEEATTPSAHKMRAAGKVGSIKDDGKKKKPEKSTTQFPWPELNDHNAEFSNSKEKNSNVHSISDPSGSSAPWPPTSSSHHPQPSPTSVPWPPQMSPQYQVQRPPPVNIPGPLVQSNFYQQPAYGSNAPSPTYFTPQQMYAPPPVRGTSSVPWPPSQVRPQQIQQSGMPRYPQQPPPQAFQSPPRPPQQQPVTPQRPPQQPGFDPFSQPEQQQKQQKAASQQSKPQQQPTAQSSTPFGFDPFSKPKPQAQQPVSSPPKKAAAKAGPPNQSSSNYFSQAPDQEHDDEEEEAEEEEEVTDEESEEEEEVTPVPAKVVQKVQKGLDSRPPRKKALLIGINYPGTKAELKGCINDVRNVYRLLTTRFGYKDTRECMLVLTDEGQKDPQKLPTKQNMLSGFTWLVRDTKPGDSLYLHFSGHGSQQKDNDGDELDGLDDTLVPLDYKKAGMIVDDDLNALLLQSLPSGVQLSVFFDCCHSGTALDLPYIYDQNGTLARTPSTYGAKVDVSQKKSAAHVVMFSGCKDEQTSADASIQGEATGAMTHSLLAAMKSDELPTYRELLKRMLELLRKKGYSQVPQLSSGTPIDMDMKFSP